jgi:hypothetical protein
LISHTNSGGSRSRAIRSQGDSRCCETENKRAATEMPV